MSENDVRDPVPLTRDQVTRLFEVSRGDRLFHPLIVTAACTGMHLGEVCNLKWSAIDLDAGTIAVPLTDGHSQIAIPLLLPLRTLLTDLRAHTPKERATVFLEAARRYNFKNACGIHSRRGYLLNGVKAFIGQVLESATPPPVPARPKPPPSPALVEKLVQSASFPPAKAERLTLTYRLFAEDQSYTQIALATGRSKGQCSEDLRTIERLTGCTLRPGTSPKAAASGGKPHAELIQATRRTRDGRQASVYGTRSFRPIFCMLALEEGISPAVIERIVGRRTAQAAFDRALATGEISALPQSITTRALALARDVIAPASQTAIVNAVLHAVGLDAPTDPKRLITLLGSSMVEKTKSRIRAALKAAGI